MAANAACPQASGAAGPSPANSGMMPCTEGSPRSLAPRGKNKPRRLLPRRFDRALFRQIMGIGLPAGVQMSLVALGAMVVRLVFTLPCFFLLAEAAWPLSTELFALSFGRGKRSSPVLYGSRYFLWFVLCAVILALGVFCERLLTPLLFRLALGAI